MDKDIIDELLEQPETSPVQADNESIDGSKKLLGKFASTDELAKAYENLQTEFSRKSQILAELQKDKGHACVASENPPVVPVNREEIIKDYLTSIAASKTAPTVITTASDLVFGAKPEPRSLRDMERVAEIFFKQKEKIT